MCIKNILFQRNYYIIHSYIIYHHLNISEIGADIKDKYILKKLRRKPSKQSSELPGNWLLFNYVATSYSVMENDLIMYILVEYDVIYSWDNIY